MGEKREMLNLYTVNIMCDVEAMKRIVNAFSDYAGQHRRILRESI